MRRTEVLQGIRLMKFEEILDRTRSRELSQGEAASVLGGSERTFRRRRDRYDADGAEGLYDRRRSHHETPCRNHHHLGAIGTILERIAGIQAWIHPHRRLDRQTCRGPWQRRRPSGSHSLALV